MVKLPNNKPSIHPDSVSLGAYENMADHYYKDVDTKPWNAYYERPGTLSLLPDVRGKKVLDAGCAAGWYTQWLLNNGAKVIAVDFSPKMIEMTRRRIGDKAEVVRSDLNQPLDFIASRSLDLVLSSLTLHYLKTWETAMSEFNRVLKPKGNLVFSVHHPFMDFTVFKRKNYFLTELLEDEWKSTKVKVQFFRRPLDHIINPVLEARFIIEKLLEPMPTEQFKLADPEGYAKLTRVPQFLFIRARKA